MGFKHKDLVHGELYVLPGDTVVRLIDTQMRKWMHETRFGDATFHVARKMNLRNSTPRVGVLALTRGGLDRGSVEEQAERLRGVRETLLRVPEDDKAANRLVNQWNQYIPSPEEDHPHHKVRLTVVYYPDILGTIEAWTAAQVERDVQVERHETEYRERVAATTAVWDKVRPILDGMGITWRTAEILDGEVPAQIRLSVEDMHAILTSLGGQITRHQTLVKAHDNDHEPGVTMGVSPEQAPALAARLKKTFKHVQIGTRTTAENWKDA